MPTQIVSSDEYASMPQTVADLKCDNYGYIARA